MNAVVVLKVVVVRLVLKVVVRLVLNVVPRLVLKVVVLEVPLDVFLLVLPVKAVVVLNVVVVPL